VVKLGGSRLFVRERKFRWGVEGRLKIPETTLFVGVDANLGKGPDDLRFLFGTRFDIGALFHRHSSVGKTGAENVGQKNIGDLPMRPFAD